MKEATKESQTKKAKSLKVCFIVMLFFLFEENTEVHIQENKGKAEQEVVMEVTNILSLLLPLVILFLPQPSSP